MARPKKEGKKNIRKDNSMDPEQYERLMNYCRQQDRPISWVIRQALESYLPVYRYVLLHYNTESL